MKQPYNTALYMRLSRDDESFGDSVSIETQRTILRRFASENNLHVVDEYIDDGWSGTNFDRPNFQRMMADVEAGKVNCIASKDLSRFGREHIMMDYYLEFVFPEKGIRYIAVSDNEDTEKGLSDFVPFKNLFNEWLAKDTSRKVKNSLHAKFLAGGRTFAYALLGYKRDPEVKNRLVIDEGTRWIVEKIFDLAFSRLAELHPLRHLRQHLRRCAGKKALRMDDCAGQEHHQKRDLHRQQRPRDADQHFLQEQEEGPKTVGGMAAGGEHPRGHYLQGSV